MQQDELKYTTLVRLGKEHAGLLRELDTIENSDEAVKGAFRTLMSKAAPAYFSESMVSWVPTYHSGQENYLNFFEKKRIIHEMDVLLMHSKTGSFSEAFAFGWGPKGIGKTGYFTFAKYLALESRIFRGGNLRLAKKALQFSSYKTEPVFEEDGIKNEEERLMGIILTAAVMRRPVSDIVQEYGSNDLPISISMNALEVRITNPTTERVQSAIEDYNRFFDYAGKHSSILCDAHALLVASEALTKIKKKRKTDAGKQLSDAAECIAEEADRIVKGLKCRFPELEKLVA